MNSERVTYTFGPLERRGLLGPLRVGQVVCLAGGAVLAVATLDAWPTAGGAIIASLAFVSATACALWPIGRRSLEEWAPVAIGFAWRRALRRTRFRSPTPTAGTSVRRIQDRKSVGSGKSVTQLV